MSSQVSNTDRFDVNSSGLNKKPVFCPACSSRILSPETAEYVLKEYPLPHMRKKKGVPNSEVENEPLSDYWFVNNVYIFDNIGVSKAVEGKVYLTCADCDVGPIGWYDSDTKLYYVAIQRVKHDKITS